MIRTFWRWVRAFRPRRFTVRQRMARSNVALTRPAWRAAARHQAKRLDAIDRYMARRPPR